MRTLVLVAAVLALHAGQALAAAPSPACAAKRAGIEQEIAQAQARGNSREVAGLKKALRANRSYCTDASLAKDRDARIRQAQRKLNERENSLRAAENKGDAHKIADRKAKLEAARSALAEAEKPLVH